MRTERNIKKRSIKRLIIFLLVLSSIFVVVFMNKKIKAKNTALRTEKIEVKEKTSETSYSQNIEGKNVRIALNGMMTLYSDASTQEVRLDLTLKDVEKVQLYVNELEDGKMKTELTNQLKMIEATISE
ncbi:hypothetical protein [Vagococcus fluvialis]|uniref:hypothetical protein n=1 Tax=Vagococcus fluvialis TaxID=2738 RepID=UPI003B5B2C1E